MQYDGANNFEHDEIPAIGVLLTNVGTPDAPTTPALRKYLRQFLGDPRVIEVQPRWKWKLILEGIILRKRPPQSAKLYQNIWTDEGSPLLRIAQAQAEGVQKHLRALHGGPLHVELGMGYGEPSVGTALRRLREKKCRKIFVLPGFPQYCAATTGSTWDAVADELKQWRWVPELRFNTAYHDHPGYIDALAASVRDYWAEHGEPDKLLISFHGVPLRYFHAGDPYHCQCQKTARLLVDKLGLGQDKFLITYQSRFGREPWLQPYTDETLERLAKEGTGRIDTMAPGFSADCLETLEEMNITNREIFEEAGGKDYHYIPALNDRPDHIVALADVAARQMQGWLTPPAQWSDDAARREAEAIKQRADTLAKTSPNACPYHK